MKLCKKCKTGKGLVQQTSPRKFLVYCTKCDCETVKYNSKKKSVNAWNGGQTKNIWSSFLCQKEE